MSEHTSELSASQVEDYLQQHPDFFQEHLNLLEQMRIPHPERHCHLPDFKTVGDLQKQTSGNGKPAQCTDRNSPG